MARRTRLAVITTLATMVALIAQPSASGARVAQAPSAPRNIILLIGDGMGPEHLELARLMAGHPLKVDAFPASGSVDTHSLDGITDSAAAATAIATGVETYNGWLSMAPDLPAPQTVLERAELAGKATGLITDLVDSDATPAAFTAHVPDRDLEEEITRQMAAHGIEVLFSGGWEFSPTLEGLPGVTYVRSLNELQPYLDGAVPWTDRMYGFFGPNELAYSLDREEEGVVGIEPTLPQLTEAALSVLGRDPDGFFLMVESGSNDWGGHARDAAWVSAEMSEMDQNVEVALDYARSHPDTLIVATGDHETGGLQVGTDVNLKAIKAVKATTEFMWGMIRSGRMTIKLTLANYAGVTRLTKAEEKLIATNKEMGIADVLSARERVAWGWSGTDEGDHTATPVPVYAEGPGASEFGRLAANEDLGRLLLSLV